MAEFVINQDVVTAEDKVEVTITSGRQLPLGRHQFRLVVVDDSGLRSANDDIIVIVADQDAPTAILRGPKVTAFGRSFTLDGIQSFDTGGGRIVQYIWTYLGPEIIR